MPKGDIVLIQFHFTNLTGSKLRPAVILIDSEDDVTVCFMTTQVSWQEEFDIILVPSTLNGLHKHSLIRLNKIATIDSNLLEGLLGRLSSKEIGLLNSNLKKLLQLE